MDGESGESTGRSEVSDRVETFDSWVGVVAEMEVLVCERRTDEEALNGDAPATETPVWAAKERVQFCAMPGRDSIEGVCSDNGCDCSFKDSLRAGFSGRGDR